MTNTPSKISLWIDDIRPAPDDTWIVARTVTDAIRILATMPVEVVSLDHDSSHQVSLDGRSRPYPCAEDFTAVAYFLGVGYDRNNLPSCEIRIHSGNAVGAERLKTILT